MFFFVMALCACCSPPFNNGFWGFKFLSWAVLLIATLFISNNVFDGYVWVARVGAFIFTIMQQIVLIDLAYRCVSCFRRVSGEDRTGQDRPPPELVLFGVPVLFAHNMNPVVAFVSSATRLVLLGCGSALKEQHHRRRPPPPQQQPKCRHINYPSPPLSINPPNNVEIPTRARKMLNKKG